MSEGVSEDTDTRGLAPHSHTTTPPSRALAVSQGVGRSTGLLCGMGVFKSCASRLSERPRGRTFTGPTLLEQEGPGEVWWFRNEGRPGPPSKQLVCPHPAWWLAQGLKPGR